MKTIRHIYRKHATTIDCLTCIAVSFLCVLGIILCIIHGETIDTFYPNRFQP